MADNNGGASSSSDEVFVYDDEHSMWQACSSNTTTRQSLAMRQPVRWRPRILARRTRTISWQEKQEEQPIGGWADDAYARPIVDNQAWRACVDMHGVIPPRESLATFTLNAVLVDNYNKRDFHLQPISDIEGYKWWKDSGFKLPRPHELILNPTPPAGSSENNKPRANSLSTIEGLPSRRSAGLEAQQPLSISEFSESTWLHEDQKRRPLVLQRQPATFEARYSPISDASTVDLFCREDAAVAFRSPLSLPSVGGLSQIETEPYSAPTPNQEQASKKVKFDEKTLSDILIVTPPKEFRDHVDSRKDSAIELVFDYDEAESKRLKKLARDGLNDLAEKAKRKLRAAILSYRQALEAKKMADERVKKREALLAEARKAYGLACCSLLEHEAEDQAAEEDEISDAQLMAMCADLSQEYNQYVGAGGEAPSTSYQL